LIRTPPSPAHRPPTSASPPPGRQAGRFSWGLSPRPHPAPLRRPLEGKFSHLSRHRPCGTIPPSTPHKQADRQGILSMFGPWSARLLTRAEAALKEPPFSALHTIGDTLRPFATATLATPGTCRPYGSRARSLATMLRYATHTCSARLCSARSWTRSPTPALRD